MERLRCKFIILDTEGGNKVALKAEDIKDIVQFETDGERRISFSIVGGGIAYLSGYGSIEAIVEAINDLDG